MQLSVIIVNYNVKYFLEHCLVSVEKALRGMEAEVFVVDNASTDGSFDYLASRFKRVHFIANEQNLGFAKANNQALIKATGKYILFLNPDTLVPEDCFVRCFSYMESNPSCGALGIRMIDGAGHFLRESKRSFPSPSAAFYKLSGLSRLFPHSPVFSKYHLGHLPDNKNQVVDVLAGAFMWVRKEVLDKNGSFDETFFMYGEDVDLSYRIQQAGWENHFFADSTIIHFKGESTRKGSLNYVKMFYQAMSVFVRKHYGQTRAGLFNAFIQSAIWLRAGVSAAGRFIRRLGLPLLDAALVLLCIWVVKLFWFANVRTDVRYVREVVVGAALVFTSLYLITGYFSGLYDKPYRQARLNRSALAATLLLLALYGLMPERFRFSRGIIFFSGILSYLTLSLQRWILIKTGVLETEDERDEEKQTLVIGTATEYEKVTEIFASAGMTEKLLGRIDPVSARSGAIGTLDQFDKIARSVEFKELILCEGTLGFGDWIDRLPKLPGHCSIKFFSSGTQSIIGSDSQNAAGESISIMGRFKLAEPAARRGKRMLDIAVSLILILFFPLLIWLVKKRAAYFKRAWQVLTGAATWIGYATEANGLPVLRTGIFQTNGQTSEQNRDMMEELLEQLDRRYARQYRLRQDLQLVIRALAGN
jgi:O-antigen biosynthesis protein